MEKIKTIKIEIKESDIDKLLNYFLQIINVNMRILDTWVGLTETMSKMVKLLGERTLDKDTKIQESPNKLSKIKRTDIKN